MSEEVKKTEDYVSLVLGLAVMVLMIYGGYRLVRWFFPAAPEPVVALSAYFVDREGTPTLDEKGADSHLKITGQVQRPDNKPTDGKVRLMVETLDQTFSQTIVADVKSSTFETEHASLHTLLPSDQIHIKGDFLSAEFSPPPAGEVYLNTKPPKLTSDTLWGIAVGGLIVVFIVFFYSFTGKKTPLKNRIAIIFSYCIIGIFLLLPLLAPVFLVPSDRKGTMDRPVGLVLTRVPATQEGKVQWALNIGGYAMRPGTPSATPSPTPPATVARRSPSPTGSPTAAATGAQSPTDAATPPPTETAAASPTASPTRQPQPSPSPVSGARSPSPTPTPKVVDNEESDLMVNVDGGLVIPLYVIILSVIGGAINMTRKVPQLQEEGERSEISGIGGMVGSSIKATLQRIRHPFGGTPEPLQATATQSPGEITNESAGQPPAPAPPANAAAQPAVKAPTPDETIAAEIDLKVGEWLDSYAKSDTDTQEAKKNLRDLLNKMKDLFDKRADKRPILNFDSFDDWLKNRPALKDLFATHWRVELLNQYMYLVSAPFLAIVAYYMLELAGLTKQPVLVLISFSVGLVSERILSWLLGMASGYLRDPGSQPAKS